MSWFGLTHLAGLAGIWLACLLLSRWGRQSRKAIDRFLLLNLIAYMVIAYSWRWSQLSLATCLPLHLCDFILFAACYLLCERRSQITFECIHLLSWTSSIWALITPDLPHDFPHYRYFEFFWGHGLIFVVLAHLQGGQGYRLSRDSWKGAAWGLQLWILLVGGLDYLFNWNYGYLMLKPPAGSPLDYLGPWPFYVLVADALVVGLCWLACRLLAPKTPEPIPL
ncbi:MAG: TIGR02206 family membrane protein [Candidatus Eremiobacteraeota bacterium]|nr:TIGR02206 family membrane protein [Candidatus Eremiobacteraeota bacterium]MCW5870477.1 TIGR02206 family membrane protein [Candidatus Eremiobacteraeota bacterium]